MRVAQLLLATMFSAALALPVMAQNSTPAVAAPNAAPAVVTKPVAVAPVKTAVVPAAATAAKPATAPVSINTATVAQLDTLPGIGAVRSGKIIAARPYKSLDELVTKKAISAKEFDRIKDKLAL